MGNDTKLHRALTFEQEGRFAEALELFIQCLSDPAFDEGDIHFHCGWCLENRNRKREALQCYASATDLTRIPSCKLNCFFRSGWILMHEKNPVKSADLYRRAIDYGDLVNLKNETYVHAMYWYAHCLELQGHFLEALKWYHLVQGLAPQLDPESRLRQIFCLIHTGQYEEALSVCRTFDASAPEDFDVHRYDVLRAEVDKERRMLVGVPCSTSLCSKGSISC